MSQKVLSLRDSPDKERGKLYRSKLKDEGFYRRLTSPLECDEYHRFPSCRPDDDGKPEVTRVCRTDLVEGHG